ncbi:zona pellucida sperm-binding protein 4-like [Colossoma macropomum]|uniref:zona pellucida sperm-binding protein 4-like n=1 Tax=Colossoma macropomum TaxID=42526 RepID=UPI0018648256|nr:zona pellucida sperm-binding protein 4-like [Colossoma macropomum]
MWASIVLVALTVHLNCLGITAVSPWNPQAAKQHLPQFPVPRDPQQPVISGEKCRVDDVDKVPCGEPGLDAAQCGAINCCFDGQQCYYGRTVTVQCTIDGQFVLVVARDTTLPRLSLDSISLLGGSDAPCSAVDSNVDFAIYQFPVTACGTRAMELGDYVVYENKMSSSYEVGVGPLGAITRDSHYELYFQCRYADTTVAALAVQLIPNNPPLPVAASGPLMVELRLGSGQCVTKGCVQAQAAYTSYYSDADYPVTKVLREPVYVEVRMLGRTDPNIALVLGRCWATSSPDPFSIPQWDLLVDGCPYQDDRYLTTPIPVDGSSGLQFPSHYKRFVLKMFTFVDPASMAPLQERVFIHCSTSVCQLTAADSCEPRCSRQRRDVAVAGRKSLHESTVVSSGEVIFTKKP